MKEKKYRPVHPGDSGGRIALVVPVQQIRRRIDVRVSVIPVRSSNLLKHTVQIAGA